MKLNCNICEHEIDIPDTKKVGERIMCPNCFAQTALFKHKGKPVLACALCKDQEFDPLNCSECERRRDLKKIYEEGNL